MNEEEKSCCKFFEAYTLKYTNNINRITELSCWARGVIGVVMSFVLVGTCIHYSFSEAFPKLEQL